MPSYAEEREKTTKKAAILLKMCGFSLFTKNIRVIREFFVRNYIHLFYFNCNHSIKTKNAVNKQKKCGQRQDLHGATRL